MSSILGLSALLQQRREAQSKRRMGLGITGLADALIFCGCATDRPSRLHSSRTLDGDDPEGGLRRKRRSRCGEGRVPAIRRDKFLARPNVVRLPEEVRASIGKNGIRNGCLTRSHRPARSRLLAGNVRAEPSRCSISPTRAACSTATRRPTTRPWRITPSRRGSGCMGRTRHWPRLRTRQRSRHPATTSPCLRPLQPHVDSAISKTVNVAENMTFEAFKAVYLEADRLGLKGLTTFRPNAITGAILQSSSSTAPSPTPDKRYVERLSWRSRQPPGGSGVVYMSPPLEREGVLSGFTYKLKWPASDHAIYVTINDIERCGRRTAVRNLHQHA